MHRYIVDAKLSVRVKSLIASYKRNVIHVKDLESSTKTKDREINLISIREKRIVITRDHDFLDSFFSSYRPYKLLFISEFYQKEIVILEVLSAHFEEIEDLFASYGLIEIKQGKIISHT